MKYYPMDENKTLIKSFIEEVFNKHNLTAADKYIAAAPGREGFKQMLNRPFLAFPDIHGTVEHMLSEDNLVVVYLGLELTRACFKGVHLLINQ
jgi:predicted ester cyclase